MALFRYCLRVGWSANSDHRGASENVGGEDKKTAVCVCVCVKDQVDAPTHSSKEMYPGPADCPGKQSRYLCGGGCLLGVPAAHTNSARTARTASSVGGCFGIVVRNVAWVCADICVGSTAQHNSVD